MNLIHIISVSLGAEKARILEEHIGVHIQLKPRWLPKPIWYKILKRLLVLEMFNENL